MMANYPEIVHKAQAAAFSRVSGPGIVAGMDGPEFVEPEPTGFFALLTDAGDPALTGDLKTPYAWTRQYHFLDNGQESVTRSAHPFSGTTTLYPAFSVNDEMVALPTVVWAERGEGDFYLFGCGSV